MICDFLFNSYTSGLDNLLKRKLLPVKPKYICTLELVSGSLKTNYISIEEATNFCNQYKDEELKIHIYKIIPSRHRYGSYTLSSVNDFLEKGSEIIKFLETYK